MRTHTKPTPTEDKPRPATIGPPRGRRSPDPAWKPEPCGLTRDELREIVAEVLG